MHSMIEKHLNLQTTDFGLTDYETVWALQKTLVEQRLADEIPDTILIGEHPPVITLGRGSHLSNLLNPNIPVVEIERGGDVTFHGPGQLIAYPILKLDANNRDLHKYLRNLEEVLIRAIAGFGLDGLRNPGWTGVWIKAPQSPSPGEAAQFKKLASIGVAVKKWVTYHGIALNVSTDLGYYRQINPCGLESSVMSSLSEVLQRPVKMDVVKAAFIQAFQEVFNA